jgi:hypothetical protein
MEPIYDKIYEKFPCPAGSENNYNHPGEIPVNGGISGTATISNVVIDWYIHGSWISYYGKCYKVFSYSLNNFSHISNLKFKSGSGHYSYDGYYNDSKTLYFDYLRYTESVVCDVIFTHESSGTHYEGQVEIKYSDNITSYPYPSETIEWSVKFENGTEFTW